MFKKHRVSYKDGLKTKNLDQGEEISQGFSPNSNTSKKLKLNKRVTFRHLLTRSKKGNLEIQGPEVVNNQENDIDWKTYKYPFESLVFSGGGIKGYAYIGAIYAFEDAKVLPQIKRVAGSSVGAICAALVAINTSAAEIERLFLISPRYLFQDQKCVFCCWPYALWRRFGVHPVDRFYQIYGDHIAQLTGDADITFRQVLERFNKELVIPVTNISRMKAEYCSPSTTPDLPIRKAVRISLSFPVLYAPVQIDLGMGSGLSSYSDGGLISQYPIYLFDEYYDYTKSMRDLTRLRSGRKFDSNMLSTEKLSSRDSTPVVGKRDVGLGQTEVEDNDIPHVNTKTLGLYVMCETAIEYQLWKSMFESNVPRPPKAVPRTKLSKQRVNFTQVSKKRFTRFLRRRKNTPSLKNADEMAKNDEKLSPSCEEEQEMQDIPLFDFKARRTGPHGDPVRSFPTFALAMLETLLVSHRKYNVRPIDSLRTISINTGYIWTNDYDFEAQDRLFLLQEGFDSTRKYLQQFSKRKGKLTRDDVSLSSSSSMVDEVVEEKAEECSDLVEEMFNPVVGKYENVNWIKPKANCDATALLKSEELLSHSV